MAYDRTGTIRTDRLQPADRLVEQDAEDISNATLDNVEVADGVAKLPGPDIPATVVAQFSAGTFSTGDGTWTDDIGDNDMSLVGDLQSGTFSDGSPSVVSDGNNDGGAFGMPAELEGSGFQQSAVEVSIQTNETNNARPLGVNAGGTAFYIALNRDHDFNSDDGNFVVFVEGDSTDEWGFSPTNSPNINDGARHDISIILNDTTEYDADIIIDESSVSVSSDQRGTSAPTNFDWNSEMGVFGMNDGSSLTDYADGDIGVLRLHDSAISSQTIGD